MLIMLHPLVAIFFRFFLLVYLHTITDY